MLSLVLGFLALLCSMSGETGLEVMLPLACYTHRASCPVCVVRVSELRYLTEMPRHDYRPQTPAAETYRLNPFHFR